MKMRKYTVMIIFGGEGYESEVSVKSARFFEKLNSDARIFPIFVYISKDGRWYLSKNGKAELAPCDLLPLSLVRGGAVADGRYIGVDLALPVLHGDLGEDGFITAILLHHKIKCVGSTYCLSSLLRDKAALKLFAKEMGIPTCDFVFYPEGYSPSGAELDLVAERLSLPVFVKPRRLGSSLGASLVTARWDLENAFSAASLKRGGGVIIERRIDAEIEAECAYLSSYEEKYAVGAVLTEGREYSFNRKYRGEDGIKTLLSYPRCWAEREKIVEYSNLLVRGLGIGGLCRVDFFVTRSGEIFFNEINHMPGFTEDSLFPRLAFSCDSDFCDWVFYQCLSRCDRNI
jgi:D-alanine--D-alanine ligase